ncbi:MAG: SelB C-terminal domain-containing protein [Acidobacteria bacterium]|nr:SelB C-terminal domain-containing protein [Acidobacteriota bacterium]
MARAGLAPESVGAVVERLCEAGAVRRIGDRLVEAEALRAGGDRLLAMVSDFHRANPLRDGMPREEARERVFRHAGPGVFEAVLDELTGDGRLVARDHLALPGHKVTLSPEELRASEGIVSRLRNAGLRPPAPAALREEVGIDEEVLDRLLRRLAREQAVVRVGPLVFDFGAVESLKADLVSLKAGSEGATIDVATFKERYGVSRKFAIPLLEYLDRERLTRRVGGKRVVL